MHGVPVRDPDTPPDSPTAAVSTAAGVRYSAALPGGVAQLVRAPACHAGGRGFESRRSRYQQSSSLINCRTFLATRA